MLLVSSFGCSAEGADIEFSWIRRPSIDKGTNLGRHLIQAFEPGETTPEASLFSLSVRFMVWLLSKNGRKKRHRLLAYNVKRRL